MKESFLHLIVHTQNPIPQSKEFISIAIKHWLIKDENYFFHMVTSLWKIATTKSNLRFFFPRRWQAGVLERLREACFLFHDYRSSWLASCSATVKKGNQTTKGTPQDKQPFRNSRCLREPRIINNRTKCSGGGGVWWILTNLLIISPSAFRSRRHKYYPRALANCGRLRRQTGGNHQPPSESS